jgi:hypothetical protein
MSYIADAPLSKKRGLPDWFNDAELDDVQINMARSNFGLFRKEIRKGMLWGWWTQEVSWQLQRFYNEMVAGMRPKLAISAPPQHGKSWAATDFIAYVAGQQPDRKTIFGSYSVISVSVLMPIFSASSQVSASRRYFPARGYRKKPPAPVLIAGSETAA